MLLLVLPLRLFQLKFLLLELLLGLVILVFELFGLVFLEFELSLFFLLPLLFLQPHFISILAQTPEEGLKNPTFLLLAEHLFDLFDVEAFLVVLLLEIV